MSQGPVTQIVAGTTTSRPSPSHYWHRNNLFSGRDILVLADYIAYRYPPRRKVTRIRGRRTAKNERRGTECMMRPDARAASRRRMVTIDTLGLQLVLPVLRWTY